MLRVLFVEDNPKDVTLISALLEQAGYNVEAKRVDTPDAFRACLLEAEFDVIICDYNLQGWTAIDGLEIVRETGKNLSLIVVSGSLGDEAAVGCIKHGAIDYVLKDRMARLPSAIAHALEEKVLRERQAEAERALRSSEERYRLLFESNPQPMWVYDSETLYFLEINEAAISHYGYSRTDFLRMTIKDIRPSEDIPKLLESVSQGSSLRRSEGWRHLKKNGEIIDVEIVSHDIIFAGRPAVLVLAKDVTERKRTEKLRLKSEARFRRLIEANIIGVAVIEIPKKIVDANEAFLTMTGYDRDDLAAGNIHPYIVTLDGYRSLYEQVISELAKAEVPVVKEADLLRKDGSRVPVMFGCALVGDSPLTAASFIIDLTERRRLEEQFRQAQRMEAVGRLAGGVAHDFNNLLGIILGYSELLLGDAQLSAQSRHRISEVMKAANRAAEVTRQLLAFSRKQVFQVRTLDLNQLVESTTSMLVRLVGEDVTVKKEFSPKPCLVQADPTQIEQIIMNLAINSRDAMPKGGELTIKTENVELDVAYRERHVHVPPGSYVMLAISDTGIGMDQETQQHIFEPFFTTKAEGRGTGLGLSTVYGIVKQSGGYIWVYSEAGMGTTLKIYLPRVYEPAESTISLPAVVERGTGTILLVEDDDSLRQLDRELLEQMGYIVWDASNGTEAIRVSEQTPGTIDLLMSDVIMPGMNGKELAEILRKSRPSLKILLVSGYTHDVIQHVISSSDGAFLQKPFTREVLSKRIRQLLVPQHPNGSNQSPKA